MSYAHNLRDVQCTHAFAHKKMYISGKRRQRPRRNRKMKKKKTRPHIVKNRSFILRYYNARAIALKYIYIEYCANILCTYIYKYESGHLFIEERERERVLNIYDVVSTKPRCCMQSFDVLRLYYSWFGTIGLLYSPYESEQKKAPLCKREIIICKREHISLYTCAYYKHRE